MDHPTTPPESVKPWPTVATRHVGDFRIFTLRSDIKVSPRTGREHDFYVIRSVDWVNVMALTPDRTHLVMVEQYRHGSNTIELEIPGGMMDPEEKDPLGTGARELREETGYEGDAPRLIGTMFPNAAIMDNRCHTILIENCVCKHALEMDQGEDLAVRLVPVEDLVGLVAQGKVRHAIAIAALFHFDLWRRGLNPDRG
jgi:8-oxo-dGTP pyrophosphatase MutT (NUDIX family)